MNGGEESTHAETMRVAVEATSAKPVRAEIDRPNSNRSVDKVADEVFD